MRYCRRSRSFWLRASSEEIADEVEDGGVADEEVALDGLVADGLREVGLAEPRRPEEEDVGAVRDEVAGGQVEELLRLAAWD